MFVHHASALLFTRVVLLGPIERLKIIMQTKHMAAFANPRSDMPKSLPDLVGKISLNQGIISFYRGQVPLMLLLTANQSFKFFMYDKVHLGFESVFQSKLQQTLAASSLSAVLMTTLMYPMDLCHTRMSADMSKKKSVYRTDYKNKDQKAAALQ